MDSSNPIFNNHGSSESGLIGSIAKDRGSAGGSDFIILDQSSSDIAYRLKNMIKEKTFNSLTQQYYNQKRKFGHFLEDHQARVDNTFFEVASFPNVFIEFGWLLELTRLVE